MSRSLAHAERGSQRRSGSGGELELTDEDDATVIIANNVVAMQPVALGIEVELPFGAAMDAVGQDRIADCSGLGAAGAKGGSTGKLSAARAAAFRPRSIFAPMPMAYPLAPS